MTNLTIYSRAKYKYFTRQIKSHCICWEFNVISYAGQWNYIHNYEYLGDGVFNIIRNA